MPLIVVGLSHKTAPVELREKLSFAAAELAEAGQSLARARDQVPLSEAILLSTCNRTEIYGLSNADARGWCLDFLRRRFQRDDLGKYVYVKEEREMVGHLFSVASGLDSLVYGENEILKQVKDAYHLFHGLGLTGKVLNVLFQRALYVGKLVRTHTAINQGALSVGSVAVSLAEKIFGDLSKSTVLIFGAGKMAEVSARYLLGKKVRTLLVANRTLENARTLAEKFDGTPLTLEDGLKNMIRADVVLTSASVTEPLIRPDFLAGLMLRRQNRSLFLIDIAVPRNVDPKVNDLDNVYLYDIDDMEAIVRENYAHRSAELERAAGIVREKTSQFWEWLGSLRSGDEKSLKHRVDLARDGVA